MLGINVAKKPKTFKCIDNYLFGTPEHSKRVMRIVSCFAPYLIEMKSMMSSSSNGDEFHESAQRNKAEGEPQASKLHYLASP